MTSVSPERILYCDTDGIFLIESDRYPSTIPCGTNFGEFKDELDGDKIVLFVCAGSKTYAYVTQKGVNVVKAKGLTISNAAANIFSPASIREMIEHPEIVHLVADPLKIFHMKGAWSLGSRRQEKKFRFVFDKRVLNSEDFTTQPYGYHHPPLP